MKYPQLVSTRAVNAISDWLVSRLEQIGVEAPLIYSRLLLSLLHTSVQINDPIEFSNLERYFTNQKGCNKRFLPQCDTETIKKFTAIQCLLDAVSTEQEISCIENLVDELFEKLINLEKQSNDEEETFIEHHHQLPSSIKSLDIEDPRKRYYRAFPALSKEMEDSVWLTKRNDKSLTWPASNSGTSSANNMVALNTTAGVKRKNKRRRNQALNKGRISSVRKNSYGGNSSPTWDTDFEGNWEMGTDLIKEFLMSQKNRNRSISESDATNFIYEKNTEKRMKPTKKENNLKSSDHLNQASAVANNSKIPSSMAYATNNLNKLTNKSGMASNPIAMKDINMIIGNNNIDDDMNEYVPYNELISYKDFDNLSNMTRQMYQDEISYNDDKSAKAALQQQQNDFAQFEAKFNSDVEALWKDDNKGVDINLQPASLAQNLNHQRNIDNFWTNYYNHHYNKSSVEEKAVHSLVNKNSRDIKNDFYSLPSNFGTFQGKSETSAEILTGEHELSSVGVFISDSIWSDNGLAIKSAYNDDDSFYNNGWAPKNCEQATDTCDGKEIPNAFNISKWSECSFETPFVPTSANLNIPSNIGMGAPAKHLYGGVFKHTVNASTASNKTIGPNNMFHQANQQLQSQHQVSQPVSLPDYYGSSLCCFATEKDPKITSAMMTAIVPQLQQALTASTTSSTTTTTTTARSVSLTNHSKTSGFIEYSIVKSSSSYFQFNQIAKFDRKNNANNHTRAAIPAASANSLPSSGLVDGANVALSTAVNISSASSSSPLDDDDNLLTSYRTHFRPIKQNYADGYQFDISGSLDEVEFERSDSGSLYLESEKYFEYTRVDTFLSDEDSSASSICSLNEDNRYRDIDGVSDLKGLYPLKFRMKQTEKQCQTDVSLQMPNVPRVNQVAVTNNLNIKSSDGADQLESSRDEVDYSTDSECCLNEDEVSIDLDKWSMAEIGKKCADNNNTHTLWGMCPACTKENKCVPANRLLKDELIIEADEIMSDLKYMQDLYICSDWENDENDTDSELEALKNDDEDDDESGRFVNEDSVNDDDDDDNEEQEQIFYNITKLISDLLKPENAKSLVNALSAGAGSQNKNIFKGISSEDELSDNANNSGCLFDYQKNVMWKNVNNNNNEKYIGGLWSNDENIIWKREMKPWSNWPRLNDNKTAAFLEKLNWKHANLAAIWKNGSIAGGGEIEVKSSSSSLIENFAKHAENSASDMIAPSSRIALNQTKFHLTPPADEHIENKSTTAMDPITQSTKNPVSWNISSTDAVELLAQRRYHKQPNKGCPIPSQTITNRPDRKRRHSASQNISCSGSCSNDSGRVALEWCVAGNREMSAKIGGCNKVEIMAKWESDSSKLSSLINVDDSLSSSSLSPKTTIITCKYWTTMDTTLDSPYFMDKSSLYDGIGAMTLNPSSILRHVAVVSRPLTR